MSVRVLNIEWEGHYSCRYCGAGCINSQWAEDHTDEHCLSNLQYLIDEGEMARSERAKVGDLLFEKALIQAGWLKLKETEDGNPEE